MGWVLAIALLPAGVRAEEAPAKCAVKIIHALKDGGGIDGKITRLRPYLEKEPFTAWNHFVLLEDKEIELKPKGTAEFDLPNGRRTTLTYVDHFVTDDHRLRLRLTIHAKEKKVLDTTFVLDEGGVVLQAGQKHGNGLLVLGVSCQTEK
jgi:hypothetical protein